MNVQPRKPLGPEPWDAVRSKLDQTLPFANMRGTPYYRDAIYEQFSKAEYARRYAALRAKMKEHKLDCVIAAGGPSHWSFGAGTLLAVPATGNGMRLPHMCWFRSMESRP